MKLKLCGIRRPQDILYVNEFAPDYIGFVFAKSGRQVTEEQAEHLAVNLAPNIQTVGVFVNEPLESLLHTANAVGLSVIQLHGDEDSAYIDTLRQKTNCSIWKAVRVINEESIRKADLLEVDALLFDSFSAASYGGTGKAVNWELIRRTPVAKPFLLAGGLNCKNLAEAVAAAHPFGIDLSSGIETNGCKDKEKIREVVQMVRSLSKMEEMP